jgi:hypothetical protein
VKLTFGYGYFGAKVVQPKEDASGYSDARLARRWKQMVETALSVGSCVDIKAMETIGTNVSGGNQSDSDEMDVDESAEMDVEAAEPLEDQNKALTNGDAGTRIVPFGSAMLPTSNGRGSFLDSLNITALETEIHESLLKGHGFLGRVSLC